MKDNTDELFTAIVQPDIVWENIEQNIKNYSKTIGKIDSKHPETDLVILPEMFTTGFTMNPTKLAESMNGKTINWMKEISQKQNLAICGSIIINENSNYFNRFIFVKPNGNIQFYDKKHLFSFAGEDKNYTAGKNKILIEYKGWKINPFICYDLRFPVWSRNTDNADLLIYVANWPLKRIAHWEKLLPARAIENQCYTIGVNRVDFDGNNLEYNGKSCIYDPAGNKIVSITKKQGYAFAALKKNVIIDIRKTLPFGQDGDKFEFVW